MIFYTVARKVAKFISYAFFPMEVCGDVDDIPNDCGIVLCANHVSFLDAVFLAMAFKRQIRFVGKKKYAEKPFLKSIFKWAGAFGIDPDKPDLTSIKNCFKVIRNLEVLGIFPEGTRIINGKVSNPMPGAIMIAHKTKAPIFYARIKPVKGRFRLFRKTYIYVGKVVTIDELGVQSGKGGEYKEASEKLMNLIYGLGKQ